MQSAFRCALCLSVLSSLLLQAVAFSPGAFGPRALTARSRPRTFPAKHCEVYRYRPSPLFNNGDSDPTVPKAEGILDAEGSRPLPVLEPKRVAALCFGQCVIALVACSSAWVISGSPLLALGPGAATALLPTLKLGALATVPMLGFIAAGELFDLDRRFPALEAVSNGKYFRRYILDVCTYLITDRLLSCLCSYQGNLFVRSRE